MDLGSHCLFEREKRAVVRAAHGDPAAPSSWDGGDARWAPGAPGPARSASPDQPRGRGQGPGLTLL